MHDQHILMLCQQSWDAGLGTNARSLALEFARQNRVLYVSAPVTVNSLLTGFNTPDVQRLRRVALGREPALAEVAANVWVYTPAVVALSLNWLPWHGLFRLLNVFNAWLLARSIRRGLQALGFETFDLLVDGIQFPAVEMKRLLRPRRFVYYLRDFMVAVPYFRRHGPWAEGQLLRQADAVVANSAYLADYARPYNPQTFDIGQGCALGRYRAQYAFTAPAGLAAVPLPRVAYVGFLTSLRLDLSLCLALARQHPECSFVLVGPEDAAFASSALHGLPNVFFMGSKTPDELPAYLQHCDVCINPQLVNEITIGNYPLKIDEYLAMGKPVVATATATMQLFAEHVHLANDPASWSTALRAALAEAGSSHLAAARIGFAQSHNWAACVGRLYAALGPPPAPASQPKLVASSALNPA